MGQDSNIEWTHHTFNPWRGCTKVSAGCANCYAAVNMSVKLHGIKWGPQGERVVKADPAWNDPLKWDRAAAAAGERHRVFCLSLGDWAEGADTMPDTSVGPIRAARLRMLALTYNTPNLDWLLLTKRPENVVPILTDLRDAHDLNMLGRTRHFLAEWVAGRPPANVWLGTSVEDQPSYDARVSELIQIPAAVRFLSMEPLLGPVEIRMPDFGYWRCPACGDARDWDNHAPLTFRDRDGVNDDVICHGRIVDGGEDGPCDNVCPMPFHRHLHWVIVGGESGPHARPMHPDWASSIRRQCAAAGVPFHFKQWGEWVGGLDFASCEDDDAGPPGVYATLQNGTVARENALPDGAWHNWADEGDAIGVNDPVSVRVGKKAAGRLLDGAEHNGLPTAEVARG